MRSRDTLLAELQEQKNQKEEIETTIADLELELLNHSEDARIKSIIDEAIRSSMFFVLSFNLSPVCAANTISITICCTHPESISRGWERREDGIRFEAVDNKIALSGIFDIIFDFVVKNHMCVDWTKLEAGINTEAENLRNRIKYLDYVLWRTR